MHTPIYLSILILQHRFWTIEKLISEDSTDNVSVHLSACKQVGGLQIKHFKL